MLQGLRVKTRMIANLLKPQLDTRPIPVKVFNQAGRYIDTISMQVGDTTYMGLLFNRPIMVGSEWRYLVSQRRMARQDGWIVTVYIPLELPDDPAWPGWVDWESFNDYLDRNGGNLP